MKCREVAACIALLCAIARGAEIQADESNYKTLLGTLQPGDTLVLAPGDYTGRMTLRLHGREDAWITIKGPDTGPQPRFLGDPSVCCNTIEIRSGSYVALENLTIDGRDIDGIFAISASGSDIHHIRVENCTIVGHGASQGTVAISTKAPTWGWIIRRNRIIGAGTGMYLGNADGTLPFIGGLIELNLFDDSRGYNTQIKHQNDRPDVSGMPDTPQRTIIRHNVFLKKTLSGSSGARPNLLLGGFPDSGNGSDDWYEVYGNLFHGNHREALLQVEGRVVIHDNLFVDGATNSGIYLVHHNKTLKRAYIYNNTFYRMARAIRFADGATEDHLVAGNLILADAAITGDYSNARDNLFDTVANAGLYVRTPSVELGRMDFYPLPGAVEGSPVDLSAFTSHADWNRDFNGTPKGDFRFRGAYAGSGTNPGWQPDAERKVLGSAAPDTEPPTGTIRIAGGAATTTNLTVELSLEASDDSGAVVEMRFSNDNATWSAPEPYAGTRPDWPLDALGGSSTAGAKTVWAQFRDPAGNWSDPASDAIEYVASAGEPPAGPSGCGGGAGSMGPVVLFLLGCSIFRRARTGSITRRGRPPSRSTRRRRP